MRSSSGGDRARPLSSWIGPGARRWRVTLGTNPSRNCSRAINFAAQRYDHQIARSWDVSSFDRPCTGTPCRKAEDGRGYLITKQNEFISNCTSQKGEAGKHRRSGHYSFCGWLNDHDTTALILVTDGRETCGRNLKSGLLQFFAVGACIRHRSMVPGRTDRS